jgi:hypothetical protein
LRFLIFLLAFIVSEGSSFAEPSLLLLMKNGQINVGVIKAILPDKLLLKMQDSTGTKNSTILFSDIYSVKGALPKGEYIDVDTPITLEKIKQIAEKCDAVWKSEEDSSKTLQKGNARNQSNTIDKDRSTPLDRAIESSFAKKDEMPSQVPRVIFIKQKDPFFAAMCGLIVPGGANLYSENYLGAIFFGLIEAVGIITLSTADQNGAQAHQNATIGTVLWSVGGLVDIYSGMVEANNFFRH